MKDFFRNKRLVSVVAILLVLLLVIVLVGSGFGMTSLDKAMGALFTPIESAFAFVFGGIGDLVGSIFSPDATLQENMTLKEQLTQAQTDLANRSDLEQENQRLEALLGYQEEHTDMTFVFAKVTAKNPGYYFDTLLIDSGSRAGLAKGMIVVTADGLVGQLTEVGSTWSRVTCLVDSSTAVSALLTRTREYGILRGQSGEDGLCKLVYLPVGADVVQGDAVVTSGLDGSTPAGISIGSVQSVTRSEDGSQQIAQVATNVDFLALSEVLVVTNTQQLVRAPAGTVTALPTGSTSATTYPLVTATASATATAPASPAATPSPIATDTASPPTTASSTAPASSGAAVSPAAVPTDVQTPQIGAGSLATFDPNAATNE